MHRKSSEVFITRVVTASGLACFRSQMEHSRIRAAPAPTQRLFSVSLNESVQFIRLHGCQAIRVVKGSRPPSGSLLFHRIAGRSGSAIGFEHLELRQIRTCQQNGELKLLPA